MSTVPNDNQRVRQALNRASVKISISDEALDLLAAKSGAFKQDDSFLQDREPF